MRYQCREMSLLNKAQQANEMTAHAAADSQGTPLASLASHIVRQVLYILSNSIFLEGASCSSSHTMELVIPERASEILNISCDPGSSYKSKA